MKGKIFKTGESSKKKITAILYTVLAFIVAGLSLGLYFVFKDNSKTDKSLQISDANVQTVGYTEKLKEDINDSVADLLGINDISQEEVDNYSARDLLKYNIKCEVANNAATVFENCGVPSTSVDAIVRYFSDNRIEQSSIVDTMSILDTFTYSSSDPMLNFDILGFLEIGTEYFNYVQNLRDFVKDAENPLMTDDQVIDVVIGLVNVAIDTRSDSNEEYKDATNEDLAQRIEDLAQVKLAWEEKYSDGSAFYDKLTELGFNTLIDNVAKYNYGWEMYSGEPFFKLDPDGLHSVRYTNGEFVSTIENEELNKYIMNGVTIDDQEYTSIISDLIARYEAETNLIKTSLYAVENYFLNKGDFVKNLTKFGIKFNDALLKITSIFNTTELKNLISGVYNGETFGSDVVDVFKSKAQSLKDAVADTNGQVLTIPETLYEDLDDVQYGINELYTLIFVLKRTNGNPSLGMIGEILDTLSWGLKAITNGIQDVEKIVNSVYEGTIGLFTVLGKDEGPLNVVYDILSAFIDDCAYARGIESKTIGQETIELTGAELPTLIGESGDVVLALIEIVDGIFGEDGMAITDTELKRLVEIIYYAAAAVNGYRLSGIDILTYIIDKDYGMKYYIDQVNDLETEKEGRKQWAAGIKSLLDIFADVVALKNSEGSELIYGATELSDVISAILNSESTVSIKLDAPISIDIKDKTLKEGILDMIAETPIEYGPISMRLENDKIIVTGLGNDLSFAKDKLVDAISKIADVLGMSFADMFSTYYGMIMYYIAYGIDIPEMINTGFVRGSLNVLFGGAEMSFVDFLISKLNFELKEETEPIVEMAISTLGDLLAGILGGIIGG